MDYARCTIESLKFDEACVNLKKGDTDSNLWFYMLSTDCVMCPYKRIAPISSKGSTGVVISTVRPSKWRVLEIDDMNDPPQFVSSTNMSNVLCDMSANVGQYGLYELSIENQSCTLETLKQPTYPFTELFTVWGIVIILLFGLSGSRLLWNAVSKKCKKPKPEENAPKGLSKVRVKALDTFRGASTLMMIWANGGSGGYAILGHATWNGMLFSDIIFPCFLWIMGVCIPIGIYSNLKRNTSKSALTYSITKRSIMLFLIGVALNTVTGSEQLEDIRIFGVLQRFGVTYFVVGLAFLYLMPFRKIKEKSPKYRAIQDIVMLLPQWFLMFGIVIVHTVLTFGLKIPGCPTGYLGPGGLHDDGKYFNCSGGTAGYIDKTILGMKHIYQRPSIQSVYDAQPFDPEGIFGCMTSVFQVFLGVHAGVIMMTYKDWKERIVRWLFWAAIYACIGSALHFKNIIPVNKNLWSLSFVFVTTSFALAFLSGCYLLVDIAKIWKGGPFRIPGMNALVLYIGHILCYKIFPFHWRIGSMTSRITFVVETVWCVALWTIVAYKMHRNRLYVTL